MIPALLGKTKPLNQQDGKVSLGNSLASIRANVARRVSSDLRFRAKHLLSAANALINGTCGTVRSLSSRSRPLDRTCDLRHRHARAIWRQAAD